MAQPISLTQALETLAKLQGAAPVGTANKLAQVGDLLLAPIRRTLQERVTVIPIEQVEVVQSQLGDNAGVIGVARWTADRL